MRDVIIAIIFMAGEKNLVCRVGGRKEINGKKSHLTRSRIIIIIV